MTNNRFSSITHLHIFAIINSLLKFELLPKDKKLIRLLDLGCGNGSLLILLTKELPVKFPAITFEIYGLDVNDSGVQEKGYFEKTVSMLKTQAPGIPWEERVKLISSADKWPFENDFFDLIYSNQVMEHVFDQAFVFSEIRRTMDAGGYSFHLYPLRHYFYEGHLLIPFAHKFRSWTTTYHWIKWASRFGIGTYRRHKQINPGLSVHDYAEKHADYMAYQVNYLTTREVTTVAKSCFLKPSFDFTYLYYKQKIRSLFRLSPLEEYRKRDSISARNIFYFFILRYVSGITLMLRKKDTF